MAPFARIQCTAALVSSPPEKAMPTFSPLGSVPSIVAKMPRSENGDDTYNGAHAHFRRPARTFGRRRARVHGGAVRRSGGRRAHRARCAAGILRHRVYRIAAPAGARRLARLAVEPH